VAGDPLLRAKLDEATRRAEEASLLAQRSAAEAAAARSEAARQRARADGAELATERETVARRREVAAAEAKRDAAREEAAAKGRMADVALAEAHCTQERVAAERVSLRRWAEAEVDRAAQQTRAAEDALCAAVDASGGLQDLLSQQRALADSYREHALACTQQLQELKAGVGLYGYPTASPTSRGARPTDDQQGAASPLASTFSGERLVESLAAALDAGAAHPAMGQRLLAASLVVA
jgi:hypothetical protein